ncbi:MAG: DNA-protecting protein DprA [Gammaproteobacteria bacterium]|nr:MAG: DNA-protecting protein DprA [Gammaproteobacteria bacterium]
MRWGHVLRAEAMTEPIRAWIGSARASVPDARIRSVLDSCAERDIVLLTPGDDRYPAVLAMIPDPPALLFVRGDPGVLGCPQIAVVGARRASRRGLADAAWIASELSAAGFVVTSGLALGIDGAAHEAVLAVGGLTVGVLGSGLDRIHPRRHHDLAHRICRDGALVSEFLPATAPAPQHFPRRNRIIAGLALGVVVVEASERSGSLITARLAAEQGREVFALPTTARDPGGAGCHRLIRDGARLVAAVGDILEELPSELTASLAAAGPEAPHIEAAASQDGREDPLLGLLDADGTVFDALLQRSGLDAATLNARLFELELDGRIARERQRWIRLQ